MSNSEIKREDKPNPVVLVLKKKDGTEQKWDVSEKKSRELKPSASGPIPEPAKTEQTTQQEPTIPRSQSGSYQIVRRSQSSQSVALEGMQVTFYKHSWERYKLNHKEKEEWERTSHGIVALLSLLKEMKRTPKLGERTPTFQGRPGGGGEAKLVHTSDTAFVSSSKRREVGMWDAASQEAFKENLNEALNKLTVQKIKETVDRIVWALEDGLDKKNQDEYQKALGMRRQDMADMIVRKAANEPVFAIMYGDFTKAIESQRTPVLGDVGRTIVAKASAGFDDWLRNPGSGEGDEHRCRGYALFFGSLGRVGLVRKESLDQAVSDVVRLLNEDKSPDPNRVVMLDALCKGLQQKALKAIPDSIWKGVDELAERDGITPRLHFILKDVAAARKDGSASTSTVEVQRSRAEQNMQVVREAYSEYCDDDSVVPKVNVDHANFVQGAVEFLMTLRFDDVGYYCTFVSAVLRAIGRVQPSREAIAATMRGSIDQFAKDKIDQDVPQAWQMITALLCEFMIKGILDCRTAESIHGMIADHWDVLNDLKYYLYDFYDFLAPVEAQLPSQYHEISDALLIPGKISKPPQSMRMSRLIATAVVRAVFVQLPVERQCTLDDLSRYKDILRIACHKQPGAFKEAVDEFNPQEKFRFTLDDLMKFLA